MAGFPVRALVASAITAAFLASCGGDGGQPPGNTGSATGFTAAVEALCEARDLAAEGETSAAEEAFFDSAQQHREPGRYGRHTVPCRSLPPCGGAVCHDVL